MGFDGSHGQPRETDRSGMGWDGIGWDGMGWETCGVCVMIPVQYERNTKVSFGMNELLFCDNWLPRASA